MQKPLQGLKSFSFIPPTKVADIINIMSLRSMEIGAGRSDFHANILQSRHSHTQWAEIYIILYKFPSPITRFLYLTPPAFFHAPNFFKSAY